MNTDGLYITDTAKSQQRAVLLEALKRAPVSTLDARERLSISHPAGRICELRKHLHIKTSRIIAPDSMGRLHPTALYTLISGDGA